ncbi:MAG: sugar ABC transporter permease [Sphaerochaetaceae bacterium]|jgi:cellobiose transport system permease protein|nr:sugar ABC transporter permease [Sphaerochaetaceae bacterium]
MKQGNLIRRKSVSYAKWGYFFIAPFFVIYIVFQLIPLISTFYNSFFETYRVGLKQIGPNFVGLENYKTVLTGGNLPKYTANTFILWIMGFIPQMLFAVILSLIFTSSRLNLKGKQFFKTVMYMPNLIMASAFSMLFFALFSDGGPVNNMMLQFGWIDEPIRYFAYTGTTRGLIATMNTMMWFGNTTILLMAGIMGIDSSLFEASRIDGASTWQIFWKVTIPLIAPIMAYVLVTSLIGGIQMFDVPQILTNAEGRPDRTSTTLIMYLNNHLFSKNYGLGGAVSVFIFFITLIPSIIVYKFTMRGYGKKGGGR